MVGQAPDDLVTAGAIAKARTTGATEVVMVTHGGMNTTIGHGLGQQFVEGESVRAAKHHCDDVGALHD